MPMDCEAARELIDAWALGALDDDERQALQAHLAGCAACARLADEASEAAAALALAVPLRASSAALKARVLASAAVLGNPSSASMRWWRAGVAALVVLGAGTIAWGAAMQLRVNDLEDDRTALSADATAAAGDVAQLKATVDTQNVVLDVALQPDVQWAELAGTDAAPEAKGRCLWSRTEELGAFLGSNLPPPPAESAYQMWLIYGEEWVRAGEIAVDSDGRGRLIMREAWSQEEGRGRVSGFAVTLEPVSAPEGHSGTLVLQSPPE